MAQQEAPQVTTTERLAAAQTQTGEAVPNAGRVGTGLDGGPGPQGAQGLTGAQGSQGVQGAGGVQGPQGLQGDQGVTGAQGVQGTQGRQGFQGLTGAQGPQGVQGTTGSQGNQGAQGSQGSTGSQGSQGAQGATGSQGTQGNQGTQGRQGFQGVTGSQGSQGNQGFQGVTGAQGAQGFQGPQGNQGFQGLTGAQGSQGTQGVQGTQGFQGPPGGFVLRYTFDTTTTDSDPGNGKLRLNNSTPASAAWIYADLLDAFGNDVTTILDAMDDQGSVANYGVLMLFQENASGSKWRAYVLLVVTTVTGYRKLSISSIGGAGTFDNGAAVSLGFSYTGLTGPTGPQGAVGPGSGDVLGPGTNTDGFIAAWSGTNSKTLGVGRDISQGGNGSADSGKVAIFDTSGNMSFARCQATDRFRLTDGTHRVDFALSTLTANRVLNPPDAGGTLALTTDIPEKAWVNFDATTAANQAATYARALTTVTVTLTAHGYLAGHVVYIDFTSGGALDGLYTIVSIVDANNFTVTTAASGTIAAGSTLSLLRRAISASGGIHSVSYPNAAGTFYVNFTTAFADAKYAATGNAGGLSAAGWVYLFSLAAPTAQAASVQTNNTSQVATNFSSVMLTFLR